MAQARLRQRLGWCAAGLTLAGWLAGCSHAPLSATDCGWHYRGGAGLLGLAGAMGAFDRDAGPDCHPSGYAATSADIPNEVWMPPAPEPAPFPAFRRRARTTSCGDVFSCPHI
jgi:hypothetical protein